MGAKLEKLIPLDEAAERLSVPIEVLTRLCDSGKLGASTHQGIILVSEGQLKKIVTREQFSKLEGQPITMAEASEKYHLTIRSIWTWTKRGHITKLDDTYPVHIDEADVAYCAAVYHAREGKRGAWVFDESGHPYELKRPEVAAYRKEKAKKEHRTRARV